MNISAPRMSATECDTPAPLANDYRFIRLLGEGANGKTWLARTLIGDNNVAIKALKFSQIESLKSYELFQREAEILQSLTVHGVPKFYHAIMNDKAGECFLIQQYVSAPSIQSYIDSGRKFTERETLRIIRKLAEILRELETNYAPPIIHRDIKPSNILCEMPDTDAPNEDLDPWLIDFGAVANPQKRQQGSTVAGTLGYMAPEQIIGDSIIQSDYYALGATILHMLTGVPPYEIPSELFALQFKPVLKQNAPATSKNMIELLDILLDKAPSNRPQNISELIHYIENVSQNHPPKADHKTTFVQHFRKFISAIARTASLFYSSAKLTHAEGTLTGVFIHENEHLEYEYFASFYYTIEGESFSNISLITHSEYVALTRIAFPVTCDIKYDAHNRAFSFLDREALPNLTHTSIIRAPQGKASVSPAQNLSP